MEDNKNIPNEKDIELAKSEQAEDKTVEVVNEGSVDNTSVENEKSVDNTSVGNGENSTDSNFSKNSNEKVSNKLIIEKVSKQKEKKSNKKKDNKPSKVKTTAKNTLNEIKKVKWPTFKTVLKQTGIVLAVVIVFALVIFGFDRILSLGYNALIKLVSGS